MAIPLNTNPIAFAPSVGGVKAPEVQVDFTARIDEALTALNDAADTYESDDGRTAQAILDAKLEWNRLLAEAHLAAQRLKALEAAGSALDVYNASVSKAESALQKLVELLTNKVQNEVITSWFGHLVSIQAISKDRRQDLRIHKKIVDLKKFHVVSTFAKNATPEEVAKRANYIGEKMVELKQHLSADSKA
jgi:hypothetical protein